MKEKKCEVELNTFLEDLNILIEGYGDIVNARGNLTIEDSIAKNVLDATIRAKDEFKQNLEYSAKKLVNCILKEDR